ncbi:excisionase family DNA-binding protein [Mycolicibacterium vanbaalenii]|uniref:excisionase family DNA-binding protein n=1 Tax=Mycolicibacterium vanbaalenii TaxID=110539 RepID=UPI00132F762D
MVTGQGEFITVQAAADRLAVSRWMIYRLIWEQRLKSVQIGRCRRIVRQSLDEYVAGLIDGTRDVLATRPAAEPQWRGRCLPACQRPLGRQVLRRHS